MVAPKSLRALAKSPWEVRPLGQQLMVSAGPFTAYFDIPEDAFVPTEKERRLPRTAAIGNSLMQTWVPGIITSVLGNIITRVVRL